MPLYEYCCKHHGPFDEFESADNASKPAPCPECGEVSPRMVSLPRTRVIDKATRIGMERNEKSRHEPRKHVCGSGCNHDHSHAPKADPRKMHNYTGARPWVIELA